jgi:mono/diheme cytochrome c family protein
MNRKTVGVCFLVIVMTALSLVPAWGGGWAVVTLDELPANVQANEPFMIGFTVRQHGRTPLAGLEPSVVVTHAAGNDRVIVPAKDEGPVGHYTARITLPSAGEWTWGIDAFGALNPMPSLVVAASPQEGTLPAAPPTAVVGASGIAALLGLTLLSRRRLAIAAAAIAVSVILAGAGFMVSKPVAVEVAGSSPSSLVDVGAALFVAKGCVTCHTNGAAPNEAHIRLSIGPDLSVYSRDPAFLRVWLANPAQVRGNTEMPDLDLSPDEIEALIAFLNVQ